MRPSVLLDRFAALAMTEISNLAAPLVIASEAKQSRLSFKAGRRLIRRSQLAMTTLMYGA